MPQFEMKEPSDGHLLSKRSGESADLFSVKPSLKVQRDPNGLQPKEGAKLIAVKSKLLAEMQKGRPIMPRNRNKPTSEPTESGKGSQPPARQGVMASVRRLLLKI